MKSFSKQFIECKELNLTSETKVLKYKNHPGFLPSKFHKAFLAVQEELKNNPDAGLKLTKCLRFGGVCHSGKQQCKDLRNK